MGARTRHREKASIRPREATGSKRFLSRGAVNTEEHEADAVGVKSHDKRGVGHEGESSATWLGLAPSLSAIGREDGVDESQSREGNDRGNENGPNGLGLRLPWFCHFFLSLRARIPIRAVPTSPMAPERTMARAGPQVSIA